MARASGRFDTGPSLAEPRSRAWWAVPAAVLVATVLGLLSGPATTATAGAAHARLVGSTPADGESVDVPPGEVVVVLTAKPATIEGDPLQVYGPDGRRVDAADAHADATGRELTVTVDPRQPLPAGEYQVAYRIVSADSHVIAGRLSFTARGAAGTDGAAATSRAANGRAAAGDAADAGVYAAADAGGDGHLKAGGADDPRPRLVAAGAVALALLTLVLRRRQSPARRRVGTRREATARPRRRAATTRAPSNDREHPRRPPPRRDGRDRSARPHRPEVVTVGAARDPAGHDRTAWPDRERSGRAAAAQRWAPGPTAGRGEPAPGGRSNQPGWHQPGWGEQGWDEQAWGAPAPHDQSPAPRWDQPEWDEQGWGAPPAHHQRPAHRKGPWE